ncbi:MAG: hypothetical protein UU76_C0006G0020 [Parcubacteria group bacterium GW2011_GWC1_41_7]|nr:MAG: hypothetical protein UU76_C0006G0020 [Parcubacteria group bacterium GW2011_GWC1_41_7]
MLSVKNLSVDINGTHIIKDVSFEVKKGEVVLILGPNGAGKTTLLKAVAGLITCEGEVKWSEGVKIGFVPQKLDFQQNIPMTVEELFSIVHGIKNKKEIEKYLSFSRASHLQSRQLKELSGGELQRILIAFVMAENPNVLLFDEPMAGIDIGGEETIYQHLQHIVKEHGLTVLMVSHDLSVVFRIADKVICLNKTIQCIGAPKEIKDTMLEDLYGGDVALYPHAGHDH